MMAPLPIGSMGGGLSADPNANLMASGFAGPLGPAIPKVAGPQIASPGSSQPIAPLSSTPTTVKPWQHRFNSARTQYSARQALAAAVTVSTVATVDLAPTLFSHLPTAPMKGMMACVSDSSSATWGSTITGGGTNTVLAFYDGTNWLVK